MRLIVATAGRWKAGGKAGGKAGPERALFEHYAGRITFPFELREIEEKKKLKPAASKGQYIKRVCLSGTMTPSVTIAVA